MRKRFKFSMQDKKIPTALLFLESSTKRLSSFHTFTCLFVFSLIHALTLSIWHFALFCIVEAPVSPGT